MANIYTGSNVGKSGLEIKKTSGSPDVRGVTEISLDSNLTLTDNGNGSVSIDSTGGGGGSAVPGGSNTEVQFNDSNTFGGTANLVFDKTNARLGVGISAPLAPIHVKSNTVTDDMLLLELDNGTNAHAPDLTLYRKSPSPAADDGLGHIRFRGQNSSGVDVMYASIYATARDVTASSEYGSLIINTEVNGADKNRLAIRETELNINDNGVAELDFRVESGSQEHMLFVQGSTNRVGIKQSTPAVELDVGGTIRQTNTTDAIVYANASGDLGSVSIGAGLNLSAGTISLSTTGVTAATYGTATEVPQIVVDDKGRITSATSVSISGVTVPAGANTQIQFNNSGALGANANFVFDTAATEMAIGGTNPKAKLTLYGDGTLGGGLNLADSGGDDWYIYQNTANELVIRDDSNDRIFVDTSGNLGIGVSNPAQALDVDGSIQQSAYTDNIAFLNDVGTIKGALFDQSIALDVTGNPGDTIGKLRANFLTTKQIASTSNGPLPRRDILGTLVPFGWIAIPSSVTQLGANAPSTNGGNVYVPCWYSP